MITVRFSTGFSVQYNTATFIEPKDNCYRLLTEKDGTLIARAPIDAIIEFVTPCRTYMAASHSDLLKHEIDQMRREIRSLTRKVGKVTA